MNHTFIDNYQTIFLILASKNTHNSFAEHLFGLIIKNKY
jgi:hypothetical protein